MVLLLVAMTVYQGTKTRLTCAATVHRATMTRVVVVVMLVLFWLGSWLRDGGVGVAEIGRLLERRLLM